MSAPSEEEPVGHRPFITSARRFSAPPSGIDVTPGPGNYTSPLDWQPRGSSGHRGYGPFASGSSRLSSRLAYTGPGPGSYGTDPGAPLIRAAAPCSAVFHKTDHAAGIKHISTSSSGPPALAPGQYTPATTNRGAPVAWGSQHKPGASAAFKSTSRAATVPGSVEYLVKEQQKLQEPNPPSLWLQQGLGTAEPQGRPFSGPKRQVKPKRQAGVPSISAELASQLAAVVFEGQPGPHTHQKSQLGRSLFDEAAKTAAEVPGPGAYSLQLQSPGKALQRPSSMFVQPLVAVDALRRMQQQHAALPQAQSMPWNAEQQQDVLMSNSHDKPAHKEWSTGNGRGVSAPFNSRSPRHHKVLLTEIAHEGNRPGPACYKASEPLVKVSYRQPNRKFSAV